MTREFWISQSDSGYDHEVAEYNPEWNKDGSHIGFIHVREVIPIDWEKVWKKYWEWHGSMKNENMYVDKIQELVEKQLKGE